MANTLYNKGREGFLDGSSPWTGANITAALVLSAYTFDVTHASFSADIAPHVAVMGAGAAEHVLTTLVVTNGIADADDATFVAVTAAQDVIAVVIYDNATNAPIAYIDTATGLPIAATDGGDITVAWDNGADLIFKL